MSSQWTRCDFPPWEAKYQQYGSGIVIINSIKGGPHKKNLQGKACFISDLQIMLSLASFLFFFFFTRIFDQFWQLFWESHRVNGLGSSSYFLALSLKKDDWFISAMELQSSYRYFYELLIQQFYFYSLLLTTDNFLQDFVIFWRLQSIVMLGLALGIFFMQSYSGRCYQGSIVTDLRSPRLEIVRLLFLLISSLRWLPTQSIYLLKFPQPNLFPLPSCSLNSSFLLCDRLGIFNSSVHFQDLSTRLTVFLLAKGSLSMRVAELFRSEHRNSIVLAYQGSCCGCFLLLYSAYVLILVYLRWWKLISTFLRLLLASGLLLSSYWVCYLQADNALTSRPLFRLSIADLTIVILSYFICLLCLLSSLSSSTQSIVLTRQLCGCFLSLLSDTLAPPQPTSDFLSVRVPPSIPAA